jgi:PAS domain S-box-containing protein
LFAHDQSTADAGRCSEQALAAVANDVAIRRAGVAQDRYLQKLAHEHWKLQATIRGTNAGTWEWNVQTGETRFNDRWAAIVGKELEDLGPVSIQTWLEHTHPEDLGRSQELLQKHFAGESDFYECEARMRHRDGHWVWVLDRGEVRTWTPNGEPEWMYGTHQDITERVERERRLQQNEERLQRVSETAGVGGWELDIATGQVSWSDTTFRIYGLPIGPVPPLADCISFYAPSARPKIARAVEDAISTAQPWDLELPFIRADGEQIWVRAVGRAECIDGQAVRLTGAFQDVTEARNLRLSLLRKQREAARRRREVERQQKELEKSNRLLDSFAYMVSHDLRAPLNNMRGMLEMLTAEMQCPLSDTQQQCQAYLLDAIERMDARVTGLLALSRAQSKVLQTVRTPAAEMVQAVLADLEQPIQAAHAEVVVGDLPEVCCDRGLLEQVLQNLIENALRYRGADSLRISIEGGMQGAKVWLCVEDNGQGVPVEDQERIFHMFARASHDSKGSGLGLSICALIMRKHRGSIRYAPARHSPTGAAFMLTLPS